jgi:RNA polymerase sigma factor (sigma-70 family)
VWDLRAASDDELLQLTPRRPEAFDEFYVRHERLVLAFFRRRTSTPEAAVDLTAETFVAALGAVGRYRPGEQPAVAWLFGIARKKLLRSLRKGRVEDRARRRLGAQRVEFDDEELERVNRLGTLSAAALLAELPPSQAEAIRARVLEEQPYDVVALRLRCSELVARKRVSRGLATLRDVIREES